MDYIVIVVTWLAVVLINLKDLIEKSSVRKVVTAVLIVLATVSSGWTGKQMWSAKARKEVYVPAPDKALTFNEASGGTLIGESVYIVDDEQPKIFKFEYSDVGYEEKYYILHSEIALKNEKGALKKSDADDLEGVAAEPDSEDRIYLITSARTSF